MTSFENGIIHIFGEQRKPRFGFNTHGNVIHRPEHQNGRNVTIIAAMERNGGIGISNRMPWHVQPDMEQFQRLTVGHTVIMGHKTYRSLPIFPKSQTHALPGRTNIVLTRDPGNVPEVVAPGDLVFCGDLKQAIELAPTQQIFIIGGAQIYEHALKEDLVDDMILTRFDKKAECDTFFPLFYQPVWIGPVFSSHEHIRLQFKYEYWRRKKQE